MQHVCNVLRAKSSQCKVLPNLHFTRASSVPPSFSHDIMHWLGLATCLARVTIGRPSAGGHKEYLQQSLQLPTVGPSQSHMHQYAA